MNDRCPYEVFPCVNIVRSLLHGIPGALFYTNDDILSFHLFLDITLSYHVIVDVDWFDIYPIKDFGNDTSELYYFIATILHDIGNISHSEIIKQFNKNITVESKEKIYSSTGERIADDEYVGSYIETIKNHFLEKVITPLHNLNTQYVVSSEYTLQYKNSHQLMVYFKCGKIRFKYEYIGK